MRWDVISELSVPTIQLHAPSPAKRNHPSARTLADQLADMNVVCTAVFGGFDGESYADIAAVARTIGLVPEATRASRLREMMSISDFSKVLACDAIALHVGAVPHEPSAVGYQGIVDATRSLCDHAAGNDQYVHLETGQESAGGLLTFINEVDRDNLRVNFDPANMILYGAGDPIESLRKIASHVRSVHCKDATWSDKPGQTWGTEVPLGQGDVNMQAYLRALMEIGYTGPLTIEREIPQDPIRQKAEISGAIDLLARLRGEIL